MVAHSLKTIIDTSLKRGCDDICVSYIEKSNYILQYFYSIIALGELSAS